MTDLPVCTKKKEENHTFANIFTKIIMYYVTNKRNDIAIFNNTQVSGTHFEPIL